MGELVRQTMVTTGAMTNRIDRLEERELVERIPCKADRRSVIVRLTAAGRTLVDDVAKTHYPLESRLLNALTSSQRTRLARDLRTVLVSLGDIDNTSVADPQ